MAAKRGKPQARRHGSGGRRIPGWALLVLGLLLGVGLAAVVLYRDDLLSNVLKPVPDPKATAPNDPEPPVAQQPGTPAKPKYDFYTVLPGREVVIPDAELSVKAKQEAPQPAQTAAERLLLQAGAFSDPRRADEVKAAIAFSGLVARIEPTTTQSGQTVHRVMLGPFASLRELETAKSSLVQNGIQSIAIREPAQR